MKLNTVFLLSIALAVLCSIGCNTKYQIANSKSQVVNLQKNGCLLVRLHYFPQKIEKLNELGYKKAAIAEQERIAKANKSLMSAFKKNWDFSPVYFIFPEESLKIKEERFGDINFLNENLEVDTTIKCACDYALVVEDGHIQTTVKNSDDPANTGEYGSSSQSNNYYADSSQPLKGLIVKSNKLVQLHKPFPFYTRRYKFFFERSDEEMVIELNERFVSYYRHISE